MFSLFIANKNSLFIYFSSFFQEQYGEPFLRKKVGIGKDRESADLLNKNHENFCEIADNTCKNAAQIFTMAEILRNAGNE